MTTASPAESAADMAVVFSALSDDTRWQLLRMLGTRPASASALTRDLPITRQAVAKHLGVLEAAGLVRSERVGREVMYCALGSRLSALGRDLDAIAQGWETRLDRIKSIAESGGR